MPMRRPGVRLTVRRQMIAVAVAGLALGGWQMWRRHERCAWLADRFERMSTMYREEEQYPAEAEHCARQAVRYRHVARYPWLPMPIEPPPFD